MAQDATPVGTPIGPGMCVAPTTTAPVLATPVGDVPMATPVDAEAEEGVVVEDEAVIAEATAAIENLYVCFNEGRGEAFVALFTEEGRIEAFGEIDPTELAERIEAMSTRVQAGDVTINEVVAFEDGSIAVDYQVQIGQQVLHFTDLLVNQNNAWLIADRTVELPETDLDSATAGVAVTLEDGLLVIEVSPNPFLNQPAVKLQFTNTTESTLYAVLLQGEDAASVTTTDLTQLPEDVTFIGDVLLQPGEIVGTLFEELEEGNYVIVVETETGETAAFDLTIDPPFDPTA